MPLRRSFSCRSLVEQRAALGEGMAEMADYFEVSEAALVNRLKSLGLYGS